MFGFDSVVEITLTESLGLIFGLFGTSSWRSFPTFTSPVSVLISRSTIPCLWAITSGNSPGFNSISLGGWPSFFGRIIFLSFLVGGSPPPGGGGGGGGVVSFLILSPGGGGGGGVLPPPPPEPFSSVTNFL